MARRVNEPTKGWTILIIAVIYATQVLLGLCIFTGGIFYVELLEKYQEGEVKTNLVGTLNSTLICLLAPFASIFVNRFSCRVAIVLGGFLIVLGCFLSFWATSIIEIILCFGIISGTGNALAGMPTQVMLGYYVKKHRHLMLSLIASCSGLGMFMSAPLTLFLINEYGVNGAYLMLGGLMMQICIFGVICEPSEVEIELLKSRKLRGKDNQGEKYHVSTIDLPETPSQNKSDMKIRKSMKSIDHFNNKQDNVNETVDNSVATNGELDGITQSRFRTKRQNYFWKTEKKDVQRYVEKDNTQNDLKKETRQQSIASPAFILFLLGTSAWNLVLATVQLHLPNYLKATGQTESHISIIMMCFSISNTVGRVLSALTSMKEKVNGIWIYAVTLFTTGCVTLGFPWYAQFTMSNYVVSVMTGFLMGAPNGVMTSIALRIIGLSNLSTAYSMEALFCAFGFLVGPVIASALLNSSGNYFSTFIFTGCASFAGSLCSFVAAILLRKPHAHTDDITNESNTKL